MATSRIEAHVSQSVVTALILQGKHRLHHGRNRLGIFVALLPQDSDNLLPALNGMVLVQLPLALDLLDLDAEADDLPFCSMKSCSLVRSGSAKAAGMYIVLLLVS